MLEACYHQPSRRKLRCIRFYFVLCKNPPDNSGAGAQDALRLAGGPGCKTQRVLQRGPERKTHYFLQESRGARHIMSCRGGCAKTHPTTQGPERKTHCVLQEGRGARHIVSCREGRTASTLGGLDIPSRDTRKKWRYGSMSFTQHYRIRPS